MELLDPTLRFVAPAQTTCNYLALFVRNIASLLSEGDANGTWQRFIIVATPQGPNNEGGPSSAPAERADGRQPPARQQLPEHGGAGPAEGVRGGQRAVPRRPHGDRQRARHAAGGHGGQALMAARRRHTPRLSPFAAGAIAIVVIGILVYLGFTKDIPFTRPYEVNAVFTSSNGLRPDSPVRIAGVDVGKVKRIEAQEGTDNTVVTMAIDEEGLPLHKDATAKIRPRIFLEGNFFVDLQPGSPGSPDLGDGRRSRSRRRRRRSSSTRC